MLITKRLQTFTAPLLFFNRERGKLEANLAVVFFNGLNANL
jgi:hypothetical protein